jgi:LysR family hydrogen peroxide-inducible transcriptional activator
LPSLAVTVENRGAHLEIRPFAAPALGRTIALVWRPSSPYGEAFRALGALFREAASHAPAIARKRVRAPA